MKLTVAVLASVLLVGVVQADLVDDATGMVNGWGVTPFSIPGVVHVTAPTMAFSLENNYAPIDYPGGVGRVPSPGGGSGERIDMEEMHLRFTPTRLQVLVVTSSAYAAEFSGADYYLGDLFLETGGRQYAVVTQSASQGLAAGSVYRIDDSGDYVQLQPGSRSYDNHNGLRDNDYGPPASVPDVAGPWAVDAAIDAGQLLGSAAIDDDTYDYGGAEDDTFVIEYSIDLGLLGLTGPAALEAHLAWGCGNDVIEVNTVPIPEPATMALLGLGMGILVVRRRRTAER